MSIGSTLQAAREHAGLSIEDLSEATRVREHILVAMEQDDFGACRGEFYARGHLRNVAAQLGLDPEPLIATYQTEHGGEPVPPAALLIRPRQPREQESRPKRANWSAALGIALLVGAGLAAAAVVTGEDDVRQTELLAAPQAALSGDMADPAGPANPDGLGGAALPADPAAENANQSPALTRPAGPDTAQLQDAAARETGPPPAEEPEGARSGDAPAEGVEGTNAEGTDAEGTDAEGTDAEGGDAEGGDAESAADAEGDASAVVVQVVATDTSWVRASDGSGDTLYEGTLRDGDTKSFADRRRVSLVVGNPDGVRVLVDGKESDLDDGTGVAHLEYEPAPAARG